MTKNGIKTKFLWVVCNTVLSNRYTIFTEKNPIFQILWKTQQTYQGKIGRGSETVL